MSTIRPAPGQMTVAELIEQLQRHPVDMPVLITPEMGSPGQASSARIVLCEYGCVWITGDVQ